MGLLLILYQLFYLPVACGVLLGLILRGRGKVLREGPADIRERLGLVAPAGGARPVWLHAASVGEVTAAGSLAAELRRRGRRLLLTTTTVAGRRRARESGLDAALAPVDLYPAVSLFLERAQPSCLILVETELWPVTLWLCARRGIRLGLANGRMTEGSFSRYRMTGGFFRPLLSLIERAGVQTEADARRFAALGVPAEALAVTGNLKHDMPPPSEGRLKRARSLLESAFPGRPRWVAGSAWRDEEETLLAAHAALRREVPDAAWVLAPRHVERSAEILARLKKSGLFPVLFSELASGRPPDRTCDCLLVDSLGELPALYGAAQAAFVGGTLNGIGGHNLLEPAQVATPVLFGPHTHKTAKSAQALLESGGGTMVRDAGELAEALVRYLQGPDSSREAGRKAERAADGLSGAAARTLAHLAPLLG